MDLAPDTAGNSTYPLRFLGLCWAHLYADCRKRAAESQSLVHGTCSFSRGKAVWGAASLRSSFRCRHSSISQERTDIFGQLNTFCAEHLAACRPIISTRGFAELLEKPPLVTLVDTAGEMEEALDTLRAKGFTDGYEAARWSASKQGTWQERARTLISSIHSPAGAVSLA